MANSTMMREYNLLLTMYTVSGESLIYKATVNICRADQLPVSHCSLDMKTLICLLASLLAASANTDNISNDLSRDSDCCEQLTSLMCELHLGDIPSCPASSCKEVAAVLSKDRSGLHWLKENNKKFQVYCTPSIPPSESRGWMMVGEVSASQGQGGLSLKKLTAPLDWSQSLLEGGRCAARQLTLAAALSPSLHRESATARCAVKCTGIKRTVQMASSCMAAALAALLSRHTWMESASHTATLDSISGHSLL